jgi:hypothetical protein
MKETGKKTNKSSLSRRGFLATSAAATAGLTILPSKVVSGLGHKAPSDKLNIVGIGVGGRGFAVLRSMEQENIIGLCDVDWRYSQNCFDYFPDAQKYWDWRVMYDEMGDDIDAVMIAGSDHTHAIQAAHAMTLGKHVYVEKPLTHTVYESRLLTKLADKHKVATQMGNQGSSDEGINLMIEWIKAGEIGEVTHIEAFTDRPIWPQGLNTPSEEMPVPDTFNWDLFVGPARMRPYHEIYTPWNFRGWWDFGTGALGDMACHILEAPFKALELGYPTKVQGSSSMLMRDSAPVAQKVQLIYPERESSFGHLPEVTIDWYDGGLQPVKPEGWTEAQKYRPEEWPANGSLNHRGGGVIFHGTKDTLVCGCYGASPWLLSGRKPDVPKTERRVELGHYMDWVRACKESPESRVETKSAFEMSGPFNEMVVMGVLAVRLQALNKELHWDGENMQFTNINPDERLRLIIEDGFMIEDGHPSFSREMTDWMNAQEFANSLIKTNYRDGWDLPDMPA